MGGGRRGWVKTEEGQRELVKEDYVDANLEI